MASRLREDDKNEKVIRGLLKLPANRRCINCNNLGPQYVCTNFWTFICTNCSGIHREFCHRVKSISMAKFTSQEVSALQEGGNERAKEIYFKEWDPQRHSVPDSSNIDRLRDLIKHVYVDRRYTGETNTDRPMRMKVPDESNESRREDSYRGDPRSPSYDDRLRERFATTGRNDERNGRFVYGERSPGYDQGDKRDPRYFEVVHNRQRDDRFGNENQNRRFEDRRLPDVVTKPEGLSPNRQKDVSASSPPTVRPVRDILGDDVPQLHVGAPPKSNGIKDLDNPAQALRQAQRTSSSSSMGSRDVNSAQPKIVSEASLIDFSEDPKPSVAVTSQSPVPQTTFPQTISSPSNSGGWAAFDVASQQNELQASTNASALESPLTQLASPASTATVSIPVSGVDSSPKISYGGQWSRIQHHQSSLNPAADGHTNNLTGSLNNQSWGAQVPQNSQGSFISPIVHSSQVSGRIPQETSTVGSSLLHSVETKPSGRKELPADFFTALYPSMPMSVSGWQRGPHPGMGYGMQYPLGMAMPTFPYSPKTMNPFDIGSEPASSHVPSFPSMTPMQVALPNISGPSTLVQSSSFGNPSSQGVPLQQSYFLPAFSPSSYRMQQIPSNMAQQVPNNIITTGNRVPGGPGSEGTTFGNISMDQLPATRYSSQPKKPNSFGSVGGNPFG